MKGFNPEANPHIRGVGDDGEKVVDRLLSLDLALRANKRVILLVVGMLSLPKKKRANTNF